MSSRRDFLTKASGFAIAATSAQGLVTSPAFASDRGSSGFCIGSEERVALDGLWQFRLDPDGTVDKSNFQASDVILSGWTDVVVPHTWQITADSAEYYGVAWYRRIFEVPHEWSGRTVRIEFEAVFHSAIVWVNGRKAGDHLRKGYTAFTLDVTPILRFGTKNVVVVRVNNQFDQAMLPRGRSSDWATDGGIYRPVRLLVTPKVFIERVDVDAVPNLAANTATLDVAVVLRNSGDRVWEGTVGYRVIEEANGLTALDSGNAGNATIKPGEAATVRLPASSFANPKLWHFDHPNLYVLTAKIADENGATHEFAITVGVRSIEAKNGAFYFNGERMRLMGVERMAGSNPAFGMAEPESWISHDHDDLKTLNCVFTRVHWPQDKRVLDYCDRHGILIQSEVPSWGADTFEGMKDEPAAEIMQNGLEQLHEMVDRDRNHPCIFSWGLCNEIDGQNPPAYQFAKRMYEEARKLDPRRLRSYASNSLQSNPGADVSAIMDFIEWNEYYETWAPGTPEDARKNLKEIHQAFPEKPIVISEYGYCACTPERPEGDVRRIEILRSHTEVFREVDYVGGLIFFCYNDYRTQVGDQGSGAMKQRIHGVVDLLGAKKPSYEVLRAESSPVEAFAVKGSQESFHISIRARSSVPSYVLRGYRVRATLYGHSDIPLERCEFALPALSPGQEISVPIQFKERGPVRVEFDLMRPTGFSTINTIWRP